MTGFSFRSLARVAAAGVLALAGIGSAAQSNQEWMAIKAKCNLSPSLVYNDWVAQGAPCGSATGGNTSSAPIAPTTQQQAAQAIGQLGANMIGQGLHQLFFGQPVDPAQHQRDVAVYQLNESGRYLLRQKDYPGALNEFQKALAIEPGNVNVARNVALAQQRIREQVEASQRSQDLGAVLGSMGGGSDDPFGLPSAATPLNSPSSMRLLRNLDGDGSVLLQGDTPANLKEQIDQVWGKPLTEPPNPNMQPPEAKDIELLFQPPAPATVAKPANPAPPTQSAVDAVFSRSGADDILQKKIEEDAVSGLLPESSDSKSKPGPHN